MRDHEAKQKQTIDFVSSDTSCKRVSVLRTRASEMSHSSITCLNFRFEVGLQTGHTMVNLHSRRVLDLSEPVCTLPFAATRAAFPDRILLSLMRLSFVEAVEGDLPLSNFSSQFSISRFRDLLMFSSVYGIVYFSS